MPEPKQRIAVVFVHGQGEQTPMTDVVELVKSVWRTDPRACPSGVADVYSTPVYDDDQSDQRRIVTQVADGRQVDFYQFYWADLMEGNGFTHLWRWFKDLMRRAPDEIPKPIWPIRQIAMTIALATGVWGVLFAGIVTLGDAPPEAIFLAVVLGAVCLISRVPKVGLWAMLATAVAVIAILLVRFPSLLTNAGLAFAGALVLGAAAVAARSPPGDWKPLTIGRSAAGWALAAAALTASSVGVLLAGPNLAEGLNWTLRDFFNTGLLALAGYAAPMLLMPDRRAQCLALGGTLILGGLALSLLKGMPEPIAGFSFDPRAATVMTLTALVALSALGWFAKRSFLTPVMTDSARMFSDSPVNIPNQNRIRHRGMQLLTALHDGAGPRQYDRVIVLAHSLGTVVAYRLLTHYWGKVYGQLNLSGTKAAAAAVETAAAALDAAPDDPERLLDWRAAVRAYGRALNIVSDPDKASPWKISDFITIGSPLTYASLLMEKSDADFREQVTVYKRHATSPPQPRSDEVSKRERMFDGLWPHHAALFAATAWTNLYFPHHLVVKGDIIGGPLRGKLDEMRLGHGIIDVPLEHDTTVSGFTHGEYWRWPSADALALRPGIVGDDLPRPPPHVAALRDAFGLFADTPGAARSADKRLLTPEASYPSPVPK